METKTDFTWSDDSSVHLSYFGGEGENRPALVILPGGGYAVCAPNEGAAVAEHFAALGYAAFVLYYSTVYAAVPPRDDDPQNPHTRFPEPLRQLAAAVAYIRKNAPDFGADSEKLTVMGFSAGGHLASCYAALWNTPEVYDGIAEPELLRPDRCILGYAVTELTSSSVMLPAIFGRRDVSAEELRRYSAVYHTGSQMPPVFMFHSVTDPIVPVQQSLNMARALEQAGIVYELHLFGCGAHAYGLGEGSRPGRWTELADSFIRHSFQKPEHYSKTAVAESFRFF